MCGVSSIPMLLGNVEYTSELSRIPVRRCCVAASRFELIDLLSLFRCSIHMPTCILCRSTTRIVMRMSYLPESHLRHHNFNLFFSSRPYKNAIMTTHCRCGESWSAGWRREFANRAKSSKFKILLIRSRSKLAIVAL